MIDVLIAQTIPLWVYQHVPAVVFVFCFGACVGSFINVVIYRLPAGMSVITPASRCPTCGAKLRFFSENLPIIGYFVVRGKCRYCGVALSPQYMIVELLMALMFVGVYLAFSVSSPLTPWWGEVGGQWWYGNSFVRTWPAFIAFAFMIAGLTAMTVIDARTFTIPIQIPLFVTFAAFVAYALQAVMPLYMTPRQTWPIPAVCWTGVAMSFGGMLGIAISCILLRRGVFKLSFSDYADYLPPGAMNEPLHADRVSAFELLFVVPVLVGLATIGFVGAFWALAITLAAAGTMVLICRDAGITFGPLHEPQADQVLAPFYPHSRREMQHELMFLFPCIVGLAGGWYMGRMFSADAPPVIVQALAASFAGYLVGGGLVWGIRILGTLAFGKEAMGLGDVHLLAAVGAVLGWFDPILIFFIAPFSGLSWHIMSKGIGSLFKGAGRELPYGPHLAVAALVVILCRPGIHTAWSLAMPNVPWPRQGLCMPETVPPGSHTPLNAPVRPPSNP